MTKRRIVFKRVGRRMIAFAVVLAISIVQYYLFPPVNHHVFYVEIPPPLETEIGDRDLSQYDYGGRVENCVALLFAEGDEDKSDRCFEDREQARSFIEEHFINRRRGYVIIESASIDVIGTHYFFIEPSEAGEWEVRIRARVPGPHTRFHRNINTWYYTEVFRRRMRIGDQYIKAGTSALVLRSRGVYELVL